MLFEFKVSSGIYKTNEGGYYYENLEVNLLRRSELSKVLLY